MSSTSKHTQQKIASILIDKLEIHEISIDRAISISKQVLELIPNEDTEMSNDTMNELKKIPELCDAIT